MPDYSKNYSGFVARWKTGDCHEPVHVHISDGNAYDAAKLWISHDEKRIIVAHNQGNVKNKIFFAICDDVIANMKTVLRDWGRACETNGGYEFYDANGYLLDEIYYPELS